jgi:hypothetical protein
VSCDIERGVEGPLWTRWSNGHVFISMCVSCFSCCRVATDLCTRHVKYGIVLEHYDQVGLVDLQASAKEWWLG